MTEIFVFGSNLAGRHGAGAAKCAHEQHGAQYGVGVGRTGSAYAIPTKDAMLKTLPLTDIGGYVGDFIRYTEMHPELTFKVTRVGCGLAGYQDEQIAPMFVSAPGNCRLPRVWCMWLGDIEDGFGGAWSRQCGQCGRLLMRVVRPGKAQCGYCGRGGYRWTTK